MSEGVPCSDPSEEKGRQERVSMLKKNLERIEVAYLQGLRTFPGEELAVAVFDPRDRVGRQYGVAAWGEEEVEKALAGLTLEEGQIPTLFASFPRSTVLGALRRHAPRTADEVESFDAADSFPVIVIASGGTLMHPVYKPSSEGWPMA